MDAPIDDDTKRTVQKIPLLATRAGPRDGADWTTRLKEEYLALIQVCARAARGGVEIGRRRLTCPGNAVRQNEQGGGQRLVHDRVQQDRHEVRSVCRRAERTTGNELTETWVCDGGIDGRANAGRSTTAFATSSTWSSRCDRLAFDSVSIRELGSCTDE